MMSSNLSIANFNAANSKRNSLYFISDWDVHFEAYTIGWSLLVVLPPFPTSVNLCANIALNPSWHLSEVIMKGVPSKCGALSTGSNVSVILMARKVDW